MKVPDTISNSSDPFDMTKTYQTRPYVPMYMRTKQQEKFVHVPSLQKNDPIHGMFRDVSSKFLTLYFKFLNERPNEIYRFYDHTTCFSLDSVTFNTRQVWNSSINRKLNFIYRQSRQMLEPLASQEMGLFSIPWILLSTREDIHGLK